MFIDSRVVVRRMRISDLAPVFHLGERLFTLSQAPSLYRTWDEYEVIDLFRSERDSCFVAELKGRVVGFALGTVIDKRNSPRKYGYLVWLGVEEGCVGRGIGARLFAAFRSVMEARGARKLLVDTEANNERALRFFEKLGFSSPRDHVYLTLDLQDT